MAAADDRPTRVLLVESDRADAQKIVELLATQGATHQVFHVESVDDALDRLNEQPAFDAVLIEEGRIGSADLDALLALRGGALHIPIIVLAHDDDIQLGLLALERGAQDYLRKESLDANGLARAIAFARHRQQIFSRADQAAADAIHSNLAKAEFLANVSHEIRTPLNTALGMAELLMETALSGEQARHVQTLRRAGDHLLLLIDDVLDLSRIEAGRVTLERRPLDLGRLIDSAVDFLRPAAQRKGVELRAEVSPDVGRVVLGDSTRLRQILVNLIGNGVKFTDAGFVRVAVEVDLESTVAGAIRFSIEDTGIGIGPQKIDSIFESFVQGDATIARRYGGAGLGLNIVKRLVDLMGGRIWAESVPGSGSRFYLTLVLEPSQTLPRPSQVPRPPEAIAASAGELAGLRILMVDDSDESRSLIAAFLKPTGAVLHVADDASSALERLERETFDVVLMDLHLPGMDGLAATRALRRAEASRGAAPVPVVALSADVLPHTVQAAIASGCCEHLAKPLRKADLLAALQRRMAERANPSLQAGRSTHTRTVLALLPKFLAHRERDVAKLRDALARLDFEPIATIAHNMRGNGVSYGFPEISDIGVRLEEAIRAKSVTSAEGQITRLEACLDRIRVEIGLEAERPESSTRMRAAIAPPTPQGRSRSTPS